MAPSFIEVMKEGVVLFGAPAGASLRPSRRSHMDRPLGGDCPVRVSREIRSDSSRRLGASTISEVLFESKAGISVRPAVGGGVFAEFGKSRIRSVSLRPLGALTTAVSRFESKAKLSVRPSVGPSHFLLSGQEKITKEKATPASRSPGILPSEYAFGLRGFPTAPPCAGEKHARIVRASLRADPPAARRPAGAPLGGHPGRSPASKTHGRGARRSDWLGLSTRNPRVRAEQRSRIREQGAHVRGHGWPSSRRPEVGE